MGQPWFDSLLSMRLNPALQFFIQLLPFGSPTSRHTWAVRELTKKAKNKDGTLKIDRMGQPINEVWVESKVSAVDDIIRLLEQKG